MRLYINVDHVATVREARRTDEPDPVEAARLAEAGGADGITVHLREDRRHINDRDVSRLAAAIGTVLNCELATDPDVVRFVAALRPFQVTLVPERRQEITTEGGLMLGSGDVGRLKDTVAELREAGSRVSLFIDPDPAIIDLAPDFGVAAVELHSGAYAHSWRTSATALASLASAARQAARLGLAVHAGHGLTYENVGPVAAIPDIEELNIGHSVVSRALMVGMYAAVSEMHRLVRQARAALTAHSRSP